MPLPGQGTQGDHKKLVVRVFYRTGLERFPVHVSSQGGAYINEALRKEFPGPEPENSPRKGGDTMPKAAESGKVPAKRQRKWDKKHLRTVSTKVSRREYEHLKALCAARCTTVYAVTQELLRAWW